MDVFKIEIKLCGSMYTLDLENKRKMLKIQLYMKFTN